ncbi:nuclear pore complex protein NUP205 isoform X1 [Cynara cardunculus var. scolymus]|uniref:nuclear pore complex protein NUP205 isoform X1 n=3 Tax=Cynara cardunculus var. scolymus TaxID=59895 RepID=UPI000D626BDB|nr:nuclear pore complex protein NUP205 isoform X1 [Cynara cardunculus var. scolymus]
MVSAKQLLSIIESTLLGSTPPSPSQRIELIHAIRHSLPSLKSLLSFPPPKPSDRAQVESKEVRLPDSGPIPLDDQDVQIALKLSDDLHLNEIDCVRLLVSANQEWGLLGRGPLDILRLAAGLWYTERRDLITALYTLLRAIVLDQGLEADLLADILKYVEDLINNGLRQRLISLIKELNREEPAGLGGPNSERYILDPRGALVERRAVVCRERLILGHCLVLSLLVVRASPKEVKDVFTTLKDSAGDIGGCTDIVKNQITYSLLFSLIISLISDALSASPDKMSILAQDVSFRHDFQETVMAIGNDQMIEGCMHCVRLAWAVHLMIIQDVTDARETTNDVRNISSCLEVVFSSNVFQYLLNTVLRTPAYQNDDEDMIYMYNAYLHKLITSFLSHPLARDKVKETKEKAMTALSPYKMSGSHDYVLDGNMQSQQTTESAPQTFVSLLEFVSEIYEKEPELLSGNDVLWTFVKFAGEDHTNFQTLVAFLKMLSTLASSEEGASKVYELLQGRTFRSISWSTLFDCLSIYEEKFKQSLQSAGPILPEFQEGDAKALVAYLSVLRKVVENGNPIERKAWFPDIEPLFKLLSYENVPPYLKGALRNSISTFIHVSPNLKDTIWGFLEQYDLPVVVGPQVGHGTQMMASQVYDMRFELNEVEARSEHYPSTISFLNLLNALIAEERDAADRGRRFIGIFRFIYDHVFGPFPQRAYADSSEKWQLVVACLQHFQMILSMYDIKDEDIDVVVSQSQLSAPQSTPLQLQLPVIELLKDFMSGKTVFRNIMGILLPGVDAIIADRTNHTYGLLLEKAVLLSLEIIILVLEKDLSVSDFWRPLYQPFDVILSQDHNQIVALLEYIRYDFLPQIQLRSIKIMSILSSRMVGLVPLLLKSNSVSLLVEDYAACLELRSEGCQVIENSCDDPGVLIMQLLIDNIGRPAPNITHFLLKFDLDSPVERTVLQPKFNYSCLKVVLDILEMLPKPDVNALLHEFGFQLLYELCSDPLTCGPTIDLLSTKKYRFFVKHLDNIGVAPLPKRNSTQPLRISSLHQRAWLLKLLALELHVGNATSSSHREVCHSIVGHLFGRGETEYDSDNKILHPLLQSSPEDTASRAIGRCKVLELLEIIQFRSPDTTVKHSEVLSHIKFGPVADDILGNPATYEKGGVYYYSERGDRLIDLNAFRDTLWQKCNLDNPQLSSFGSEVELTEVRNNVQQLLRWAWKHNKNLEEQAAQLHMLTGWSQIVEVSASRRISLMENRSEILFLLLDTSLNASSSPDCSLKMAVMLTQVSITCMAKLRDERFVSPSVLNSDTVTCLDVIMTKRLSNGACHSILFKIMMAILRHDTSEALRRRQYTLLLSYFQYCQHILDPDVPTTVLQSLLIDEQDSGDLDLEKIDQDQAELAHANLSILRKEAQSILDLAIKDATQGSESGKIMALFVLDAMICIDHEKFFLGQLQSRGFLRSCLMNISNVSYQDNMHSIDPLQRLCALEAELALLLRISHKYGKSGAQILFSMGAFEHIASCMTHNMHIKGNLRRFDTSFGKDSFADVHRQRMIISPLLRLVFSLTSLVESSDFFEVKNKVVREVIDFVKGHQLLFDQVLHQDVSDADELAMEQINLVVGILSKVWPYEEGAEYGFVQGLFGLMHTLFSRDSTFLSSAQSDFQKQRKSELSAFRLCFSLSSYLYFLVKKKSLRLQVSNNSTDYSALVGQQQPTLSLLGYLLNSVTTALENAAEEKSILLNKIQDINELPRQEVDEIINMCVLEDQVASSDNIQKRRYITMVEMCRIAGNRDRLITLVLLLAENLLNIFLIHFQNSSSSSSSESGEAVKALTYGSKEEAVEDLDSFCSKLVPILERLEVLREDKVGHNLKVFQRLASSLKELSIQKLTL